MFQNGICAQYIVRYDVKLPAELSSVKNLWRSATELTFQRYCTSCTMYLGKFESPNSDTNQDNESSGKKFGETHWNHSEKDCGLDED